MTNNVSRRQFVELSGLVAAGLGLAGCGGGSGSSSSDSIKVGIMGPFSGDVAQYGIACRNGAQLYFKQLNEKGGVMGGAIFSLGDFAIVVAATVGAPDTVSVAFNVNFMSAPKGGRLIATADEDKRGRTLGFYDCLIEDDLGTPVARMTGTVMHVGGR